MDKNGSQRGANVKITAIVEREGGVYQFTAELTATQHQFLIEYAIRDLVNKGLMPFTVDEDGNGVVETTPPESAH